MTIDFHENKGYVGVHVSPDVPAILGDKIVQVIKDFYKQKQ